MSTSNAQKRRNQFDRLRGLTGMAMGGFYILLGFLVGYSEQIDFFEIGGLSYLVAGLMVLYGVFRIYRGWNIRKNAK